MILFVPFSIYSQPRESNKIHIYLKYVISNTFVTFGQNNYLNIKNYVSRRDNKFFLDKLYQFCNYCTFF
jgi:hypothetical protein